MSGERKTHTPGPWLFRPAPLGAWTVTAGAPDDSPVVCSRGFWRHRAAESHANGRLIAAAPEMLGLLRELVEFWSHGTPVRPGSEVALAAHALVFRPEGGDS